MSDIHANSDFHCRKTRQKVERKQKGGFVKGWFGECTLVPLFCTVVPFFVPSFRFWYRRSVFCTLVPVLGIQGTSARTTLLRTPQKSIDLSMVLFGGTVFHFGGVLENSLKNSLLRKGPLRAS